MSTAPSLNAIISTIMLLRTLLVIVGLFPVLIISSPFVAGMILVFANVLTFGYGFISIGGMVALTLVGRSVIAHHAPSQKHRDEAYEKCSVVLPMLSFAIFQTLLHFIGIPLFNSMGLLHYLKYSPSLPYSGATRLGVGMLFLGVTVVIRYIGPFAIMRCSAFPVVSSPVIAAVKSFFCNCTSFDAFLGLVVAPSDTPGVLLDSPLQISRGRRYQSPTILSSAILIIVSLILALLLAKATYFESTLTSQAQAFRDSSLLVVLTHLLMTCCDGKSHELNPLRYYRGDFRSLMTRAHLGSYASTSLLSLAIAPFLKQVIHGHGIFNVSWNTTIYTITITTLMSLYLSALDLMARHFLCSSGFNLRKLILEVTPENNPSLILEVIISSLLFEDEATCRSVLNPICNASTNICEVEEIRRHEDDAAKLAIVLTSRSDDYGLDDDLLRILILESLGGKENITTGSFWASDCHRQTIKTLVDKNSLSKGGSLLLPLVRALCAYAAGLGLTLQKIGGKEKQPKFHNWKLDFWALPPGALACSEYAIIAATRCVVNSITSSRPVSIDWRSTELSIFVPVVLLAAFQLRSGIQVFAESSVSTELSSSLSQVLNVCDECADYLLKTLQKLEPCSVELIIPLKECRKWLEIMLVRIYSVATSSPLVIKDNDERLFVSNKPSFELKYY